MKESKSFWDQIDESFPISKHEVFLRIKNFQFHKMIPNILITFDSTKVPKHPNEIN